MGKPLLNIKTHICILLLFFAQKQQILAQCTNSDFEDGTFNGWTGTYGDGTCTGTLTNGVCSGCYTPDPYQHNTLNVGPNDQPSNGPAGYNHFIMTSGFDPIAGGTNLPVVYAPGSYSVRLGDAHANDAGHGGGESLKYRFTVTPNNCNFIYHYAVVLKDGGHTNSQQPYFKIGMVDGNNNPINCATYNVDATTAQTIGGFVTMGLISYKTWSTVSIPLNNYIGQTVSIQFTTRDCAPNGCEGAHWAYAYIDADCGPLQIGSSSPTICNGQNITLTAPDGEATYSWSGPGIISGANSQQCIVNMAGNYTVNMTTFGTVPCNFSLSTTIAVSPNNLTANFSTASLCAGIPTAFTDNSTPTGSATVWAWDFNNDGITDASTQNPTHTFATPGTYPVRLHIGSPPCIADTIISVVVSPVPTSAFTTTSPVCAGANAVITYTGTAPANATYNWNFAGGTIVSGSGQGPYQVNWTSSGVKNITLTDIATGCSSPLTTVPVTVNPIPVLAVSPDIAICAGSSTALTAAGATTYSWAPTAGLSGITGAGITATPVSTTTYAVTGTSLGCIDSASVTVSIKPIPTSIFTTTSPVCAGANAVITYTGTAPANAAYNWDFAGGTIVSGSGQGPYQVNWSTAGIKNVTLMVVVNGCSSPVTTMPVTVNPIPVVTVSPDIAICAGSGTSLTAAGATTYSWTPTVGLSGNTGTSLTATPAATTTYTVTGSSLGCSNSATVTVTVNPIPVLAVSPDIAICAGSSAALTAAGATTYSWAPTAGLSGITGASITASPVSTTTYAVTGTSLGCIDSASVTVSIKPIPTSIFTTTSPVCAGANAFITYTGTAPANATYNWNFAGGTIVSGSGQGPYQVNWSTAGIKNVTLMVVLNGCSSPVTTMPVTVNPIPVVTVSPDIAICAGSGTALTAAGATTYSWAPTAGLSGITGAGITATPASTTMYVVTGTSLGCIDSASVTVSIKPIPTSGFTAISPVCAGVSSVITYTGNAPANSTYAWNFAGGTIISGSGYGPYQVKWSTGGIKNISLTVTTNGCSSIVTTIPVTVNSIPIVTLSPNVAICAGGSITLTATGATNYNWSSSAGLSGYTGASVTATPLSTTTYAVTGTTLGCSDSASVTISIKPIPTSGFTAISPVCAGVSSVINYTGITPANSAYNWNFAGGTVVSGSGAGPYQVKWSTAGIKNVTLMVTASGCSSPVTTIPVTVNAIPVLNVSPDIAICAGGSTSLTATGANAYSWSPVAGLSGTAGANLTATPLSTTTYTVTGTSLGCSNSASVTVTIKPIPTSAFTTTSPVCAGANAVITYTGTAPANATYSWNFAGGTVASGAGAGPYQIKWSTDGVKNVSLSVTSLGCPSPVTTVPVTVNAIPVITASPDAAICAGESTSLTASGADDYTWSPSYGLDSDSDDNVTATVSATTHYRVTGSSAGCAATASVTVNVTPMPVAAFSAPGAQCIDGNSFNFQAGGTYLPSATFAWSFGPDANPSTSSLQNQNVVFSSTGSHTISLTISQNGCVSNIYTDAVSIDPMPIASFAADTLLGCQNLPVCFADNSSGAAPLTYQWNFGDGQTSVLQNPCHTYANAGNYNVRLQVTSVNGCKDDSVVADMIHIIANPIAAFSLSSTTIQLPATTVDILNQSQHALSYLWLLGDSGTTAIENPGSVTFATPGFYPITLYAYNGLGCVDSVQHPFTVYQEESLFVPNVFTPNGDGNNDFFEIFGKKGGWKQIEVMVFDRWGEKVFESNDMNFKWDGMYKGEKMMGGVYVYLLNIVYTNNHADKIHKGSLTLVR